MRTESVAALAILLGAMLGCNEGELATAECGGCSPPPMCLADGSAPTPYPACSCGCTEGAELPWGVCNENSCLVLADDQPTTLSCSGPESSSPPSEILAPTAEEWMAVHAELLSLGNPDESFPVQIDPSLCSPARSFIYLGLGSAWVEVHRRDDGQCDVWLGGETEDPRYEGLPTQYCLFPSSCRPVAADHWGDGGPAQIDSPYCVQPGLGTN